MARTRTNKTPIVLDQAAPRTGAAIVLDPFRAVIFPNRIRELRRANGLPKLMALSDRLPDIPYIRLSKIERGEVVARADEVRTIAAALDTPPAQLLVDVEAPGFDIAVWAQPFQDGRPVAIDEERVAVMLAAALRMLRMLRSNDRALTISVLDTEYGLPPVILSRLENAHKTLDRWNAATVAALCRLFDVTDEAALRKHIDGLYRRGELDGQVGRIADPQIRIARTRERNAALMQELESPPERPRKRTSTTAAKAKRPARPAAAAGTAAAVRTLPVYGTALPGGLIAGTSVDAVIDAPGLAGPRAFGLRVCRATLGAGLPPSATVIVDPDRPPVVGGLAVIRVDDGYRLLTVACDRSGATMGYSVTPDIAIALDDLDPTQVHAVIAAIFPT